MKRALPLLLLLTGCDEPIECDAHGYRITPEGAPTLIGLPPTYQQILTCWNAAPNGKWARASG